MTDKTIDDLLIMNEKLTRTVEVLSERTNSAENAVKSILEIMKKGEELFELRASRVLLNIFHGLTHQLEHSIEHAQEELRLESQGFDIQVIDGVKVKENANTILVVKKAEGQYDFSTAADPTTVMNENTEAFVAYFERNPQVFGEQTEVLVNIKMFAPPPVDVPAEV